MDKGTNKGNLRKRKSFIGSGSGSEVGKTAVLVERMIEKILKDGVDIDKLLVVTFTNAAAAEMRERVLDAIYRKLEENPESENLQKQIVLLAKSNICTIHSFCLDVIKNNFFELDLSANFRISSGEEIELLKQEVLDDVFEELYESEDADFAKFMENYAGYRGDEKVQEMVLTLYRMIQSMPFPKKWLSENVEKFQVQNTKEDFAKTQWGAILLQNLKEEILDCLKRFQVLKRKLAPYEEMQKYQAIIEGDIKLLEGLQDSLASWDSAFAYAQNLNFARWPTDKKVTFEIKDEVKTVRNQLKENIKKLLDKTLLYTSEEAYQDIALMYDSLVTLQDLVLKFDAEFKAKKRAKNIIDFNDIEHYALEILVKQDENGVVVTSEVAKKYQEKFEEIAIDEYQDSNEIQELILKSVSRGNNIFMVGDVKQSIYKFRQACPELFLQKYRAYSLEGNENGQKIQLFQNFRSNQNILNITNTIFENIMSEELGDIDYTEEEFLNLGADYPKVENGVGKSELHLIDLKKEADVSEEEAEEPEESDEQEKQKELDKTELEAIFTAQRIQELMKSGALVKQKDGSYEPIKYRDIVILLRSTKLSAPIFERELVKKNIPVFSDSNHEYLETMEVQTMMNVLKILDNPLDDIHLVAVMRSPIGGFSDNEILEIRLENREESVYENLVHANENEKAQSFLRQLKQWKQESEMKSLAELIWKIYLDTGFLNYVGLMPNGVLRQANLRMLFERAKEYEKTSFSGLFQFIRFTEKLRSGSSDMAAAKIIGETENVVRIMSIHKSKGLEFPVVFLCQMGKKANLQDLNSDILLDKEIGFGPQYIDYERKIQYPTAAKQAIKIKGRMVSISEEMRILYVALTRAKEKLILVGTCQNKVKDDENKNEILNAYDGFGKKLNPILVKNYVTYLDWVNLVYLTGRLTDELVVQVHGKEELQSQEQTEQEVRDFDFDRKINREEIEQQWNWQYSNWQKIELPQKTTVSQIKALQKQEETEVVGLEEVELQFAPKTQKITASRKGTLLHLVLQKLDFRKNYTKTDLQEFVKRLAQKQVISEDEANYIEVEKILVFLQSEIVARMKTAKEIQKEKTFCYNTQLAEFGGNEVSVQGMMDLYFVDKNDKLVLVDYKTDFVEEENVLKTRYFVQLKIYREALEEALHRKVDETYIYSTALNRWIIL